MACPSASNTVTVNCPASPTLTRAPWGSTSIECGTWSGSIASSAHPPAAAANAMAAIPQNDFFMAPSHPNMQAPTLR